MFDKNKVEKSYYHYRYVCFGSRLKDTAARMEETAVEADELILLPLASLLVLSIIVDNPISERASEKGIPVLFP